jgi:hypothetical protein
MQIDPRINHMVSNYSGFGNNPIILADPMGDTTRIFDLSGDFLFNIDDSHSNEDHFVGGSHLKRLKQAFGKEGSSNSLGSHARKVSKYFIGATTRADMANQAFISEGEGLERGFVLGLSGKSKELQVFDITNKVKFRTVGRFGYDSAETGNAVAEFQAENPNIRVIGFGHTHPSKRLENSYLTSDRINSTHNPSVSDGIGDYHHVGIYNRYRGIFGAPNFKLQGGNPAIIASKYGYSIYPTITETIRGNITNLYPKIFVMDYNGLKIRN